jgi:valyl-tRNA synthetase
MAMSEFSLPKTYDFQGVEQRLYAWWESQGYFRPRVVEGRKPFVISMPPPNVTGELHLGHALFVAVEDMMIRYQRMKGVPALWVPGSDHAGIATQLQVEKHLLKTDEVTREEIGREEFVRRTWEWKEKYGGIITQQLRRLGASCDWERERFTLDAGLSRAVRTAFVHMYRKGYIYRGTYLINWSPGLRTAVSDLEVEYSEEQGTLYYFRYPIAGTDEFIPVATTRPETILGDTAVAVHPEDDRYRRWIGKTCLVPVLLRPIPVIDDTYVDREFGTGALKITPGHDPADYEIGQRHGLAIVNVLNPDATMNEIAGPYAGLDRFECRRRLWADMQAAGLAIKTEAYTMQVPRSQRGGEIIEPMVSTQWFVRMKPLAEPALEAVRRGEIRIIPERFTKVYYNWLENIRDWCISRQLWWGHRIPAWHCADCGEITVEQEDPTRCAHCGSTNVEQDPDVLDTWFSAGLWPFSTLGWPEQTEDLRTYYPTSVMETGYDILFFWVARMIMSGLELTGRPPFHTVYLHGIIRDEHGRKMSKSLGNVIDPLQVMDEFGTDALRFTLLTGSTPGSDTNVSLPRVEANRNFANKLWNATRLVLGAMERAPARPLKVPEPTLADRWILARLAHVRREINRLFEAYQFAEAGRQLYEFIWGEYADWYLEASKLQMDDGPAEGSAAPPGRGWQTTQTLVTVVDQCLRMLHPFAPFVTEELWQHLRRAGAASAGRFAPPEGWGEALITAAWPEADQAADSEAVEQFEVLREIVTAIRNARAEKNLPASSRLAATFAAGMHSGLLESQRLLLASLARLSPEGIRIQAELADRPADAIPLVVGTIEVHLHSAGTVDRQAESLRLHKELSEAEAQIDRLRTLLSGEFATRAPAPVVEKERARLAELEQARSRLTEQIKGL